jgi:hypothetical protein
MAAEQVPTGTGHKLDAVQIAEVLNLAGFAGDGLLTGVEIVLAESGGDPTLVNANSDGTTDHGYWQWNSRWHPEGVKVAGDPLAESALAFKVSNGGKDFSQWATYTSGKYKDARYSGPAAAALKQLPGGGKTQLGGTVDGGLSSVWAGIKGEASAVAGVATSVPDALLSVGQAVASFVELAAKGGAWLSNPHNWLRVFEVGLGGGLVIGGLVMLKGDLTDSGNPLAGGSNKRGSAGRSRSKSSGAKNPSHDPSAGATGGAAARESGTKSAEAGASKAAGATAKLETAAAAA